MNRLTINAALAACMCAGFAANVEADAHCPKFTSAVYDRWPEADNYCLEIVTRDDGNEYARFEAEVVSQSPSGTYVRYTRPDGTKGPSVKADPPEGIQARISGEMMNIADLEPRQKVNIYLPKRLWAAEASEPMPEPAAPPPPPPPPEPAPEPEPEPEPQMPSTAGNLGWLAVFGALLLLVGGLLRFARRQ